VNHADEMMARITAERLMRHLSASGFVVMKALAATAPTTSHMACDGADGSLVYNHQKAQSLDV
jgi:hypothetical protein